MRLIDENGQQIIHPDPTEIEVDALVTYCIAVDVENVGLALSQLRPANSKRALVEYERIANAAIEAGLMRRVQQPSMKGAMIFKYFWV